MKRVHPFVYMKNCKIHSFKSSTDDIFAEPKEKALFREVKNLCEISYTDGLPIEYACRFHAALLELADRIRSLIVVIDPIDKGI